VIDLPFDRISLSVWSNCRVEGCGPLSPFLPPPPPGLNAGMSNEMTQRPDPYHEATFLNVALICDACQAVALESDELAGVPTYPDDGWDTALGNAARERGWDIREDGHAIFGFSIIRPSCANSRRGPPTSL
jgi:hypothetical protein